MAPRIKQSHLNDSREDVFSNECFSWPLKLELEAASEQTRLPVQCRAIVRFDSETKVINTFPEYYTDEDVQVKWYGIGDLKQIKLKAKEECDELRKSAWGEDSCLCVAHRKTSLMLKSDFKSLVRLSPSTPDQDLTKWCSYMDGRRGLERFASRDYALLRRKDICNTRTAVIDEHARQRALNISDPEAIAKPAREASKRARTFARFFAAADTTAAKTPDLRVRSAPSRCRSELHSISRGRNELHAISRCAPPRKKSKQFHREEFFPVPLRQEM